MRAVLRNHFGNITRPSPATATEITTGSQIRPIKEFGNPRRFDCQERATLPQETTALTSHESFVAAFFAIAIASTERTSEEIKLAREETNIKMYVLR
jgi:hypothetical protein